MNPQTNSRRASQTSSIWAAAVLALLASPVLAQGVGRSVQASTLYPQAVGPRASLAAAVILALLVSPALAQGVGRSVQASTSVTVMGVDAASRHLLVKGPGGETFTLKVSPDVKGFSAVKPGDKIAATYYRETAYAVSEPGKPLPKDTGTILAARAAKGEAPAAIVANHIVVTGAVLGIDPAANTLKVVSPKGGEVHDFDVVTPEGRQLMAKLKVGDKVTAYITEALVVSLDKG